MNRRYVYETTFNEVIKWAKDDYELYQTRAPNKKPLHKNFPSALDKYIQHLKWLKKDVSDNRNKTGGQE